jgi:ABC-type sugar transport system ATPase subunit
METILQPAMLRMENIVKEFPGVKALDNVNFEARAGEVLALVGENGAGKSTLMKVLSGVWPYPSYDGNITINGKLARFYSTKEALGAGVAIIYQELNLIPELTVSENIFLDRQPTSLAGLIDWDKLHFAAQRLLNELHITDIRPTHLIKELTVGKQQLVEIAKALSLQAKILVFDEPTSALTEKEVAELFRIIRKLKQNQVCMVYISHKMEELREIADRVAVLRDGKTIGPIIPIEDISLDEIITRMVGRDIAEMFPKIECQRGQKTLEVKNFSVDHPFLVGEKKVKNVSFCAYQGEILGIAGLMGSGRSELVSGIFGAFPHQTQGEVSLDGQKLSINSPLDGIRHGIALVTEDRKNFGLILKQSITANIVISSLDQVESRLGLIDDLKAARMADQAIKDLGIKARDADVAVETLSGGNQQKVVMGKWLQTHPRVLILDEPTRGVDVGAKVEIYKIMNALLQQGVTIIVVSSDLQEILGICDRILVMREGRLVQDLPRAKASRELIMKYAMHADTVTTPGDAR